MQMAREKSETSWVLSPVPMLSQFSSGNHIVNFSPKPSKDGVTVFRHTNSVAGFAPGHAGLPRPKPPRHR